MVQPTQGTRSAMRNPALVVGTVMTVFLLFLWPSWSSSASGADGDAAAHGGLRGALGPTPATVRIALVADLDEGNVVEGRKPKWRSVLQMGTLAHDAASDTWSVASWETPVELLSGHAESGRGMELSELVSFQGRLLTVDDRSGIVFEIEDLSRVTPRYILMEGDGSTDKGQKSEWATVKDGTLYVGSFGKEYTNNDGTVANRNNLWVSTVDAAGNVGHEDWTARYELCRQATGTSFPGYMIQEAVVWSPSQRHWLVLPRRVSREPYNDVLDEKRGSNIAIVVDEDWTSANVVEVTVSVLCCAVLCGHTACASVLPLRLVSTLTASMPLCPPTLPPLRLARPRR